MWEVRTRLREMLFPSAGWFCALPKEIPLISMVMAAGVELVGRANPWMIWTGDLTKLSLDQYY